MDEIERIRLRCVCDGDCWMWAGSKNSKGLPTICRMVDGKKTNMSGRRWVYAASGRQLQPSEVVSTSCGNVACLNPEHLKKSTRKAVQVRLNQSDPSIKAKRGRAIKASWLRRGQGWKLTEEQAAYARSSELPAKDVAAELGVSSSLVNYIRRGHIWKDYSNPFGGLGA
jgi:hypothetical protein